MPDYSDLAAATSALRDPAISGNDLAQIATLQPTLRAAVAAHRAASPALLEWLASSNDDTVRVATAARQASDAAYQPGGTPHLVPRPSAYMPPDSAAPAMAVPVTPPPPIAWLQPEAQPPNNQPAPIIQPTWQTQAAPIMYMPVQTRQRRPMAAIIAVVAVVVVVAATILIVNQTAAITPGQFNSLAATTWPAASGKNAMTIADIGGFTECPNAMSTYEQHIVAYAQDDGPIPSNAPRLGMLLFDSRTATKQFPDRIAKCWNEAYMFTVTPESQATYSGIPVYKLDVTPEEGSIIYYYLAAYRNAMLLVTDNNQTTPTLPALVGAFKTAVNAARG